MGIYRRGPKGKKGGTWYIDYRWPPGRTGKRIRECVGPEKDEAKILLAERLKDIRQGRNPELRTIKPKPFADMVKEFLEKHAARARSPKSFKDKTALLLRYFRGKTLQEITPKALTDFANARLEDGIAKATVNRYRAILSKMFNLAIEWGYYGGENPVKTLKRFPESPGRVRFLTAKEADGLVAAAPKHLKPILICALNTGGRLTEILRLKWEDVHLDRGILIFDQTNTKSGKQRNIPISPELDRLLRERRKVRAIGGDARIYVFTRYGVRLRSIRTAFLTARDGAGLGKNVTFHTLRHTFASWFMMNDGDLYRLQHFLGHSTITLTQRYAHLSEEYLKAGVAFMRPPADGGHTVDNPGESVGSSPAPSSL